MTYNVFGGTLNPAQSINPHIPHLVHTFLKCNDASGAAVEKLVAQDRSWFCGTARI